MSVPWNFATAAYLLRRAGFGPTPAEVTALAALDHPSAVSLLVDFDGVDNGALEQRLASLRALFVRRYPEQEDYWKLFFLHHEWSYRMIFTARPLEEKLTLFWHGHFATSYAKVGIADLMRRQIDLLRTKGAGSFRELLVAVSADPAMLLWLDNVSSIKEHPNENYARELMELFSLGIGNYTQTDIQEIARCFTGWTLRENAEALGGYDTLFESDIHDDGAKSVLGHSIRAGISPQADGSEVCGIIADHPACAPFLASKLWEFFGAGPLPAGALASMTSAYAANDHSIREMLRAMLLAEEFYAPIVSDEQIKSPTELAVGTLRSLETDPAIFENEDWFDYHVYFLIGNGQAMGQMLLMPHNVKGWDGGRDWINTSTLIARSNFVNDMLELRDLAWIDIAGLVGRSGARTPEAIVDHFLGVLGPLDVGSAARQRLVDYMSARDDGTPGTFTLDAETIDTKVRGLLRLLLTTAEYQMTLRAPDPGLVAPRLLSPTYKKGKLAMLAEGSNIQSGAVLRVTGDGVDGTERFALSPSKDGSKWIVKRKTASAPTGRSFDEVAPAGSAVTLVVENPDGAQSQPGAFSR